VLEISPEKETIFSSACFSVSTMTQLAEDICSGLLSQLKNKIKESEKCI
jgi:hypothetical protein